MVVAYLTGSFLVARPALKEPTFSQTVILLLAHDENGAYGVVVNRELTTEGLPFPVYLGGPCESPGLLLLHGHEEWLTDTDSTEVAPGIYLGDADCLKRAAHASSAEPARVRVVRGYAGWGPGQLEGELAAGAWAVEPANGELLFDTPVRDLWDRLSPPAFPEPSLN